MRKLTTLHDNGEITEKQIKQVFKKITTGQRNASNNMANWEKRFAAKSLGDD